MILGLAALAFLAYHLVSDYASSAGAAAGEGGGTVTPVGTAVGTAGPQGAQGATGPRGAAGKRGPAGSSVAFSYNTKAGETPAEIARAYGVSLSALTLANPQMSKEAVRNPHSPIKPTTLTIPRSRTSVVSLQRARAARKKAAG